MGSLNGVLCTPLPIPHRVFKTHRGPWEAGTHQLLSQVPEKMASQTVVIPSELNTVYIHIDIIYMYIYMYTHSRLSSDLLCSRG